MDAVWCPSIIPLTLVGKQNEIWELPMTALGVDHLNVTKTPQTIGSWQPINMFSG